MASRTSLKRSLESSHFQPDEEEDEESLVHPVLYRAEVAVLPPIFSKKIDEDRLSWIGFFEDSIITACASGHIRTYSRPKTEDQSEHGSSESNFSNPFR